MTASREPVGDPEVDDPTGAGGVVAALRAAGCVFAEDEAALLLAAGPDPDGLATLVARRVAGEPLEHVLGWAELAGARVAVGPGVFVPRRRTALLVHQAVRLLADAPDRPAPPVVVDLCCGSGAVGLAIALAAAGPRGRPDVVAADVDPVATGCATGNLARVGGRVVTGDLYGALPAGLRRCVDLLVVNAPYVPTGAIALLPPEARTHEPAVALDGGPDGLDVVRRVAAGAAGWLADGGHLVVETSERQADDVVGLVQGRGLPARVVRDDDLGAVAVVGGPRRPRRAPAR